jgi:hypothetical protein
MPQTSNKNYNIICNIGIAKALDKATQVASVALSGALSTNLILSIIAGVSMKKLWMMISSMQIIVHYPMLKVPIPSNLLKLLTGIVDIVNLGLIPKKYIKEFINKIIKDVEADSANDNFK